MPGKPLSAEQLDAEDVYQAIELYYERGWTDGLPVVPPTEKRVRDFLNAVTLEPDHVLGEIPERDRIITAELLAIDACHGGLPARVHAGIGRGRGGLHRPRLQVQPHGEPRKPVAAVHRQRVARARAPLQHRPVPLRAGRARQRRLRARHQPAPLELRRGPARRYPARPVGQSVPGRRLHRRGRVDAVRIRCTWCWGMRGRRVPSRRSPSTRDCTSFTARARRPRGSSTRWWTICPPANSSAGPTRSSCPPSTWRCSSSMAGPSATSAITCGRGASAPSPTSSAAGPGG